MTVIRKGFALAVRFAPLTLHVLWAIGIAMRSPLTSRRVVLGTLAPIAMDCWIYGRTLHIMSAIGRI